MERETLEKLDEYMPLFDEPIRGILASVFGQFSQEELNRDYAVIVGAAVASMSRSTAYTALGAIACFDERMHRQEVSDEVYRVAAEIGALLTTHVTRVSPMIRSLKPGAT